MERIRLVPSIALRVLPHSHSLPGCEENSTESRLLDQPLDRQILHLGAGMEIHVGKPPPPSSSPSQSPALGATTSNPSSSNAAPVLTTLRQSSSLLLGTGQLSKADSDLEAAILRFHSISNTPPPVSVVSNRSTLNKTAPSPSLSVFAEVLSQVAPSLGLEMVMACIHLVLDLPGDPDSWEDCTQPFLGDDGGVSAIGWEELKLVAGQARSSRCSAVGAPPSTEGDEQNEDFVLSETVLEDVETRLGDPDCEPNTVEEAEGPVAGWLAQWVQSALAYGMVKNKALAEQRQAAKCEEAEEVASPQLKESPAVAPQQQEEIIYSFAVPKHSIPTATGSSPTAPAASRSFFPPMALRRKNNVPTAAVAQGDEAVVVIEVARSDLASAKKGKDGETNEERQARMQAEADALAEELGGFSHSRGAKKNSGDGGKGKPPPHVNIGDIMDDLVICGILGRCEAQVAMTIERELKKNAHWSALVDVHNSLVVDHNPHPLDAMICALAPGQYFDMEAFDYDVFTEE